MSLSIPNTFTQLTKAKASEVNANFDAIEAWANDSTLDIPAGSLALAKLVSGSPAQIIVCNSSGVPTYRTPSGPVAISNTGVNSLSNYSVYADDIGQNSDGATFVEVVGGTPGAGTWLLWGSIVCRIGLDTEMLYEANLLLNASALDTQKMPGFGALGNPARVGFPLMARAPQVLDADDTVTIDGVATAAGVGGTCLATGRIMGIRVA